MRRWVRTWWRVKVGSVIGGSSGALLGLIGSNVFPHLGYPRQVLRASQEKSPGTLDLASVPPAFARICRVAWVYQLEKEPDVAAFVGES
ncbi:hypothetical protein NL676_017075 [Syzygium grande]|nr:hypothetical protein NL676_017075 [Syzygium grande]